MTSHVVEGRALPDAIAGHPALELCNTKALGGLPSEREYLSDFAVLVLWAREHGLVSPAETRLLRGGAFTNREQHAALRQVRALRAALYSAVTGPSARAAALADVHGYVARAVARAEYRPDGGPQRLHLPLCPTVLADRAALCAHQLLEEHGTDAVGRCAASACGWVFLDPSHRRRWCVMAVCGNREKARRFADRRRARTGG